MKIEIALGSIVIIIAFMAIEIGTAFSLNNVSDTNPLEWFNKGNVLYNLSRYDEAIYAYDQAIELDQSYAEAWYGEGETLFDQGRYNESIKAYNTAIAINPKWALPWYGKGESLDQLGLHEDAIEAYDVAVELDLSSIKQK